jgi:hypothetical protein
MISQRSKSHSIISTAPAQHYFEKKRNFHSTRNEYLARTDEIKDARLCISSNQTIQVRRVNILCNMRG